MQILSSVKLKGVIPPQTIVKSSQMQWRSRQALKDANIELHRPDLAQRKIQECRNEERIIFRQAKNVGSNGSGRQDGEEILCEEEYCSCQHQWRREIKTKAIHTYHSITWEFLTMWNYESVAMRQVKLWASISAWIPKFIKKQLLV